MLNQFGKDIFARQQEEKLLQFSVGLEVERERVDTHGCFSQFAYPAKIGNQRTNQWITNDFMETMSEVVTPVADSADKALRYLEQLSNILRRGLTSDELLWPLSMVPELTLGRQSVEIAHTDPHKREYFFTWLQEHSLSEATPCGLHVNLGIHPSLIAGKSVEEVNQRYLNAAQGFLRHRFILTYLFGASPLGERNHFAAGQGPQGLVRSIRQSHYGFGTKFLGDFTDVAGYSKRVQAGVGNGDLLAEHDFHAPVRLRGPERVAQLPSHGVEYLELRMLDLNPWSSIGVSRDQVDLLRLMMAYFLTQEPEPFDLKTSNDTNETVALEAPGDICAYKGEINHFLQRLDNFAAQLQAGQGYCELLARLQAMAAEPALTLNGQLASKVKNESLKEFALQQARQFQTRSQAAVNVYRGLGDDQVLTGDELKSILG